MGTAEHDRAVLAGLASQSSPVAIGLAPPALRAGPFRDNPRKSATLPALPYMLLVRPYIDGSSFGPVAVQITRSG